MKSIIAVVGDLDPSACEIYADITCRKLVHYASFEHAIDEVHAEVIVSLHRDFTSADLERLEDRYRSGSIVGIILGNSREDIEQIMHTKVQITHLDERFSGRLDIWAFSEKMMGAGPDSSKAYDWAGLVDVKQKLKKGLGIVNIYSHSDGIDVKMPGGVLCPVIGVTHEARGALRARCVVGAYCHRIAEPIVNISSSDMIVDVKDLQAGVLTLSTCFTLFPFSENAVFFDSIARALYLSKGIGCFLGASNLLFPDYNMLNIFSQVMLSGGSVAEALNSCRGSIGFKHQTSELIVFGDPSFRISQSDDFRSISQGIAQRVEDPPSASASTTTKVNLDTEEAGSEIVDDADINLKFETLLIKGFAKGDPGGRKMPSLEFVNSSENSFSNREIILATSMPNTHKLWWNKAREIKVTGEERCPICGCVARVFSFFLPVERGRVNREVVSCPVCGPIDDRPLGGEKIELNASQEGSLVFEDVENNFDGKAAFCKTWYQAPARTIYLWRLDNLMLPEDVGVGNVTGRQNERAFVMLFAKRGYRLISVPSKGVKEIVFGKTSALGVSVLP